MRLALSRVLHTSHLVAYATTGGYRSAHISSGSGIFGWRGRFSVIRSGDRLGALSPHLSFSCWSGFGSLKGGWSKVFGSGLGLEVDVGFGSWRECSSCGCQEIFGRPSGSLLGGSGVAVGAVAPSGLGG
ncbi:hypothetical protein GALMADRAFT_148902 [Galerina marginata CBS 339.88]|uniref:Uncharacterized protein n=1 Tax=Galerina marginata (strain CBS 339.88) TaxID=685588 RepID=A0A067S320_GALM3|nr:hypothetical protein GALMADRAFT_148902 [Galerina marginata CBS 339.88]